MNLSLFDSDYLTQKTNKCEVYHFHIYIEDELDWPFEKNTPHRKGVFMHEYIHYLQHLTTLCGVSLSRQNNLLFCNYRAYFAEHDTIAIPLKRSIVAPEMIPFFELFDKIKGSREYGERVDKVRVSLKEILAAQQDKRAIFLDTFNQESGKWSTNSLSFGYYAIIESMADMVQRIYEPDVNHDVVPYQVVQKLCETYYPEVAQDSRKMIALCICALMSSNPGCGFFEAVDFAKDHPEKDGVTLYREFVNNSTIKFSNGKNTTITKWFEHQFEEYDKTVEQVLGVADYYRRAFQSSLKCAKTGDNLLLILLYDESISPDSYFQILSEYYGSPYIEAYNQTLYPGRKRMPQDVVAAIGMELLFKALNFDSESDCPRLETCKRMRIDSYDCINGNQWGRDINCPFKAARHFFRLEDKDFIPNRD